MPNGVNAVAVGAVGAGLIFVWSGIKGTSITKTFQSLVQGQQPTSDSAHPIGTPQGSSGAGEAAQGPGVTLAKGGTAAQNQAIAKKLAASYGWDSGAQWDALVWVWDHESSWSNTAKNKSSGAYGIPQALPATKLPKAGRPAELGGTSDAGAQISWGLSYIKARYGDPVKTKAFWQSHHWY